MVARPLDTAREDEKAVLRRALSILVGAAASDPFDVDEDDTRVAVPRRGWLLVVEDCSAGELCRVDDAEPPVRSAGILGLGPSLISAMIRSMNCN